MKWSSYAGLVLVSGLVLATVWVASSECEDNLCFGSKAERGTALVIAPQDPVTTEDLERIWKESAPAQSEPALTETEPASEDPATADQAGAGLKAPDALTPDVAGEMMHTHHNPEENGTDKPSHSPRRKPSRIPRE